MKRRNEIIIGVVFGMMMVGVLFLMLILISNNMKVQIEEECCKQVGGVVMLDKYVNDDTHCSVSYNILGCNITLISDIMG